MWITTKMLHLNNMTVSRLLEYTNTQTNGQIKYIYTAFRVKYARTCFQYSDPEIVFFSKS